MFSSRPIRISCRPHARVLLLLPPLFFRACDVLYAGPLFRAGAGEARLSGVIWGVVLVDILILTGLVVLFLLNTRLRRELDRGRREVLVQEKKFQAVFENHRQLCGLLDPQGMVMAINRQALELIGCRQDDVQGRPFPDTPWWTHSEEERARLRRAIADIRGGKETVSFDTTHVDGRGRLHNIDFSLSAIRGGDGELLYMLALGHDVTTLRHSRQLYHSFFDNTPDPVLLLRDGVIIDCNRQALRLFGGDLDRLTGLEPSALVAEDGDDTDGQRSIGAVIDDIVRTGVQTIEWQARRLDGTRFDAEWTLIPLHIGNTCYLQIIIRDVTRIKETQRELVMAKHAFDHSALPIVWYVPGRTLEECRFFYVNDAACRVTGYTREEFLQFSIADISKMWTEENFRAILDHIRSKGAETYETLIRHRDGHEIPMEVNTSYFRLDEKEYFFVIAEEISRRKQLEEELRQAQKMEALGTLAGGIAHDFNNILSAIFGYTELALHGVGRESEPGRHLEQVHHAAERARMLVQQILTFSRKTRERRHPVPLVPAVREALQLLRSTIPTSITIESEFDSAGRVMADVTRIQQVVMNLCTNGYHAMRDGGGTLRVRVVDVELSGKTEEADIDLPPGGYVLLSVADTGVGMDDTTRERIFDPYFTTKEAGEGTGLGLAVVHGIVQSYGGAIRVSSRVGRGSVFDVFLPRIDGDRRDVPEKAPDAGYVGGTERIMFVDDEELIVNMSRQLLGRFGYTVRAFTSSREALAHFRAHADEIDLVITDLTMPEMSGVELARRIMEIRPGQPVILCTGYSEEMNRDRVLALGIARFVQKPLVMEEMLQTVRAVLDSRSG